MKAFGLGQSEEKNRHQVRSQVWTSFCPNISNRKFELTCAKRQTLEWRPGIKTVCAVQPPPILYIFSIRSHLTNLKMECFYPFVLAFIKLGNLRPLAASSLVHVSPALAKAMLLMRHYRVMGHWFHILKHTGSRQQKNGPFS